MDTQKFKEIANAYAAGCLDREDYPALLEVINSGDNLNGNELGKLQNVIALLPAILEIERPDMRTKDKVARKLYRMRDEVRTKRKPLEIPNVALEAIQDIKELTVEPVLPEQTKETPVNNFRNEKTGTYVLQPDSRKLVNEVQFKELNDKAEAETPTPEFKNEPETDQPGVEFNLPKKAALEETAKPRDVKQERKGAGVLTVVVTALILSLLSGGAVYYLLTQEAKKDKAQIASLSNQVNSLKDEFSKLEKNQRVLALLGGRDTKTFNLGGTMANPNGFGRIVMSSDGKDGVLQLYNMPALSGSQIYRLWAVIKGQPLPMGSFKPKKNAEYFPIDQVPAADLSSVDSFNVTLEQNDQAQGPSKDVFLAYTLNDKSVNK